MVIISNLSLPFKKFLKNKICWDFLKLIQRDRVYIYSSKKKKKKKIKIKFYQKEKIFLLLLSDTLSFDSFKKKK